MARVPYHGRQQNTAGGASEPVQDWLSKLHSKVLLRHALGTGTQTVCARAGTQAKLDLRRNAEGLYDVVGAHEAHVSDAVQV